MARRLGFYLHSDSEDGLPPLFGVTEANRRLTVLTKEISSLHVGRLTFGIGRGKHKQYEPTYESLISGGGSKLEHDDFDEIPSKKDYARGLRHGEVVHIYVYDSWGELAGTFTGWVGTPEAEPVLGERIKLTWHDR